MSTQTLPLEATAPLVQAPPAAPTHDARNATTYVPFPVTPLKFVVLSICTFGLYECYWCYKNWKRISLATGENLRPFWRAFFAPLCSFALFGKIKATAAENNVAAGWNVNALGIALLALTATWRLPQAWALFSFLTFLPYLPVVQTAASIHAAQAGTIPEDRNGRFTAANIVTVILGGSLVILTFIGSFLPTVK